MNQYCAYFPVVANRAPKATHGRDTRVEEHRLDTDPGTKAQTLVG